MSTKRHVCLLGLMTFGGLLTTAAPALVATGIAAVLQAEYDAWTPAEADTTPLALLRKLTFDWATAPRSGTSVTVLAAVSPAARSACEAAGVEVALVTRPLRLA